MKLLTATIRPEKIDVLAEKLIKAGIVGMTAYEVKGFGRQLGQPEVYRGSSYTVIFKNKVKVEIFLEDNEVERAVEIIEKNTRTGKIGDGIITILPAEELIRIRTGERHSAGNF